MKFPKKGMEQGIAVTFLKNTFFKINLSKNAKNTFVCQTYAPFCEQNWATRQPSEVEYLLLS